MTSFAILVFLFFVLVFFLIIREFMKADKKENYFKYMKHVILDHASFSTVVPPLLIICVYFAFAYMCLYIFV